MGAGITKSVLCRIRKFQLLSDISHNTTDQNMDQVTEKQYGFTNIHACKLSFEWKIYNYKISGKGVGEPILSPEFSGSDKNTVWYIALYPTGKSDDVKEYLSVYLYLKSTKVASKVQASVKLYILNKDREKCFVVQGTQSFAVSHGLGWNKIVRKHSVVNDTYLPNDCLTIVCDLTVSLNKITFQSDIIDDNLASNQKPQLQLLSNYKSLFKNGDIYDVTIIVAGKKFNAHKAILAAHSSVFLAMFKDMAMKRNIPKKIEINDIEFNTFQELLRFIYTGEIQNLDNNIVNGLLIAANKYDIKDLFRKCEQYLESKLSVDNVTSIVSLADNCNALNLRRSAINFLMVHRKMLKLDVCKFLKTLQRHTVEEIAESSITH